MHERAWEQTWHPKATYGLLAAIGGIFVLQLVTLGISPLLHREIFTIQTDFWLRPWSLVTSTLSHGGFYHLLFNGLFLFFFGPTLERIIGMKRFLVWFFVSGAVSGAAQVTITGILYGGGAALGASGALMMMFGTLMVLMPNEKILIWGIVPVPFWIAGIGYAALDVLGAFDPGNGIGNFAHLSGMAIGLALGYKTKKDMARRGMYLARA